jgi:hypothetical protein
VEPIQGEAGILIPPVGFLREAAEIRRRNRVLLMSVSREQFAGTGIKLEWPRSDKPWEPGVDFPRTLRNRRRLPKQFTTYRTPGIQRQVHPFDSHNSLFIHEIREGINKPHIGNLPGIDAGGPLRQSFRRGTTRVVQGGHHDCTE